MGGGWVGKEKTVVSVHPRKKRGRITVTLNPVLAKSGTILARNLLLIKKEEPT